LSWHFKRSYQTNKVALNLVGPHFNLFTTGVSNSKLGIVGRIGTCQNQCFWKNKQNRLKFTDKERKILVNLKDGNIQTKLLSS
jgi:hypothetical protein